MRNSPSNHSQEKKIFLLSNLVNPETYFWSAILLFGTAAAGWFLVGVGVFFALTPFIGLAAYGLFGKRKRKISCPNNSFQRTPGGAAER